jgi:hypothetical protein
MMNTCEVIRVKDLRSREKLRDLRVMGDKYWSSEPTF